MPASSSDAIFRETAPTPQLDVGPSKRGISSKEVKQKKVKPNLKDIQMKDESKPVPRKAVAGSPQVKSMGPERSTPTPPVRKPGSGYKLSRASSHELRSDGPSVPKSTPRDIRGKDSQSKLSLGASTSSTRVAGPSPLPRPTRPIATAGAGIDSDVQRIKRLEAEKGRSRSDNAQGKARENVSTSSKRKKSLHDDDAHPRPETKKRKVEESAVPSGTKGRKDLSLPKKIEMDFPPPLKKEPSPLPPISRPKSSSQSLSTTVARDATVAKSNRSASRPRRRSPVYTSSEEESDRREATGSTTTPLTPNLNSRHEPSKDALRAKYGKKYVEQLESYRDVCTMRLRMEYLLERLDKESSGTITDSGSDIDMRDAETLVKKYMEDREELHNIRQDYHRFA